MENEKKKRQKKKKNKQGKANDQANVSKQNHQNLNSENADVQNRGSMHRYQTVVDSDRESISGADTSRSVDSEKSYWLNREATLEQKIKELQQQLDVHIQREADLERSISESQKERNLWHHKEVSFEEKLTWMEEEKVYLAQRENSAAETIATWNKDNAKLRAQVIELEASRNDISHQNQQLKKLVSDLENSVGTRLSSERTKDVTENEDMKSQLESAQALVEKLVSENGMLVDKVNILHAEVEQKSVTTHSSLPTTKPDHDHSTVTNSKSAAEKLKVGPSSSSSSDDDDDDDDVDDLNRLKSKSVDRMIKSGEVEGGSDLNPNPSMESGEIVQIPLDEKDVAISSSSSTTTTKSYVPGKADVVPLTDAPLIGAPFRLISFVARYVSGADLVEKT